MPRRTADNKNPYKRDDGMRIGHRLKRSRIARKLSRRELAKLAGVKPHTLARIERNDQQPWLATVRALAAALDIEVEALAPRWKAAERELTSGGSGGHPGYGLRIIRKRADLSLATLAAVAKVEVPTLSRFERRLTQTCGITDANGNISSDALADALGYDDAKQLDRACRVIREDGSVPPPDDPEPDDPLGVLECI